MELEEVLDVPASLKVLYTQNVEGQPVKVWQDLERYHRVLLENRPEVFVECGTYAGDFARWVSRHDIDVITIDITVQFYRKPGDEEIVWLTGNTVDPKIVKQVRNLTQGRRTMVALDSDHSPEHVRKEIQFYGPLVTPGSYLVVEDGSLAWGGYPGPLDAIRELLASSSEWERDLVIEQMYPVSLFPAGWLRKRGT